jgi:signal transduction histidine kinase
MNVRRLSRFRSREFLGGTSWKNVLSPILAKRLSIGLLIALSILMIAALQVTRAFHATRQQILRWDRDLCRPNTMAILEGYWREYHAPPAFSQGDEPGVQDWLKAWPDIKAVQSRHAPYPAWVRDGVRLRPGDPSRDRPVLDAFAQASAGCAGSFWIPPRGTDAKGRFSTILVGENWLVLRRWVRGSPAAETIIRRCSANPPLLRLGFYRYEEKPDPGAPYEPWGAWPNLQVDDRRIHEDRWTAAGWSMFFGEEMVYYFVPTPDFTRRIEAYYHRQMLVNSYFYLIAGVVGLLAWRLGRLWSGYRQREADLLAALTHSLKTPLTAARLRCELIGMDPQVVGDLQEEILTLGRELDQLTSGVNNGLRLLKQAQPRARSLREPIPAGWFRAVADDFAPAFEAQGRQLALELCEAEGLAAPETLRIVLQTLLENALHHGGGRARLETSWSRGRLRIQVEDEGPGLSRDQLSRTGRIHPPGRSGAGSKEGGIGLGLVSRIARDEGWGLELRTAPGSGMHVRLEIHAGVQASRRAVPC